jgi:hypothetical protein
LYSTADARYKRWWAEETERLDEAARRRIGRRKMREHRIEIQLALAERLNEEDIELQTGEELRG